jgi:hypothetical protein
MGLRTSAVGYLTVGITNMPAINASQTICFWHYFATNPATVNAEYVNSASSTSTGAIQFGFRVGVYGVYNWGGNTVVLAGSTPTAGSWHHLAYTFNGTNQILYIDGALSNQTTTAAQTGSVTSFELFGNQWGENATVILEDLRVYSRTLAAAEIETIYSCRGTDRIMSGLVSRYLFNEQAPSTSPGAGGTVRDVGENGNHGIAFSDTVTNYTYQESISKFKKRVLSSI